MTQAKQTEVLTPGSLFESLTLGFDLAPACVQSVISNTPGRQGQMRANHRVIWPTAALNFISRWWREQKAVMAAETEGWRDQEINTERREERETLQRQTKRPITVIRRKKSHIVLVLYGAFIIFLSVFICDLLLVILNEAVWKCKVECKLSHAPAFGVCELYVKQNNLVHKWTDHSCIKVGS